MDILTNSADTDEISQSEASNQGLPWLIRIKRSIQFQIINLLNP